MRTHSGVNPYKCHICNDHFRERGSLQRHMRLHTGEKPFKCHLCNRAFSEQGTLSRHLKSKGETLLIFFRLFHCPTHVIIEYDHFVNYMVDWKGATHHK